MSNFKDPKALMAASAVAVGVGTGAYALSAAYSYLTSGPKYELKYTIQTTEEETHGGHIFGECLKIHGVRWVFTLTGGHISPILVGAKSQGIEVIDVRHEVNTVFAADAVARLTGVPGVAIVTAGPGLTNTVTAVKNAQLAQSPLIVIGGATSDLLKGRGSLQDIDQMALMKPHVKWAHHISTIKDIIPSIEYAFYIAQSGTPGPVFLEIPLDLLYPKKFTIQQASENKMRGSSVMAKIVNTYMDWHYSKVFDGIGGEFTFHKPLKPSYPVHTSANLRQAAQYLKNAKQPVILCGAQLGLRAEKCLNGDIANALKSIGVPVVLTSASRGMLGSDGGGVQIAQKDARGRAQKEADVVILLGICMDFRQGYGLKFPSRCKLISVNLDKTDLYKNRTPTLPILGDPATFLLALAKEVGNLSANSVDWMKRLKEIEHSKEKDIWKRAEVKLESGKMNPLYVCGQLEKVATKNALFVVDGGDFVGSAAYIVKPRGPLTWLDPGVFGTLGVGAGFALGAKLARPDMDVYIVYGDGALGYSLIEFDTFNRHNIPVMAVIGNDACWTQIYRDQATLLKSDVACMLAHTAYEEAAKGLGGEGLIMKNMNECEAVFKQAQDLLDKKRPVLVNCIIGQTDFRKGSLSM